ncbi:BRCA1-A complex subunit BRE [Trichoplax sp. H2]|nr:BRCA1-A complex subunit BRE [Trichoplax sp. H2]|eukprot:RDD42985.1 BRCA1-A complex subunit BRE [Trichoplax sp. H2]
MASVNANVNLTSQLASHIVVPLTTFLNGNNTLFSESQPWISDLRCSDQLSQAPMICHAALDSDTNCDRFKLHLPYSQHTLIWEVIFDRRRNNQAPDFIFGEEDKDFNPDSEKLESLSYWNTSNANCFSLVIKELLLQYALHQEKLLGANSRLSFECSKLRTSKDFDSFEILVKKKNTNGYNSYFEANFLIRINLKSESLPHLKAGLNKSIQDFYANLLVTMVSNDTANVVTNLQINPWLEKLLGSNTTKQCPRWGGSNASSLLEYLTTVQRYLQDKINRIGENFTRRKELIESFKQHFNGALLEYDSENYTSINLLLVTSGFYFILHGNVNYYLRVNIIFLLHFG